MDELTLYLQRFNTEVVEASRKVSREIICHCMNSVVDILLRRIGDLDNRMKCYVPTPTQSYFEAMKVSSTDEFEVLVVLDRLAPVRTYSDLAGTNPNLACYGEVVLSREDHVPMYEDLVAVDAANKRRFLSAAKVRRYFAYIANQVAADIFHNNSVQVTYKAGLSEPVSDLPLSETPVHTTGVMRKFHKVTSFGRLAVAYE
ncbi:hypothetical protein BaRGS_00035090 [Batillaria attramentaria]|uniref:Uncharacterized protein n=1 Tax=Batillaria attramentaria TaxID=370345 RepID=A0ABD0JFI1_9CAEN